MWWVDLIKDSECLFLTELTLKFCFIDSWLSGEEINKFIKLIITTFKVENQFKRVNGFETSDNMWIELQVDYCKCVNKSCH